MKKLLLFISVILSLQAFSQTETHDFITYDTVFTLPGSSEPIWSVRISRPRNMFTANHPDTASRPVVIQALGDGEIGTDTNKLVLFGPHYWMQHGWDGSVVLGNGTHYPIFITLTQNQANVRGVYVKQFLDTIRHRYHVKWNSIYVMGFSKGGIMWGRTICYQHDVNDFTTMQIIKAFVALQGSAGAVDGINPTTGTAQYNPFGLWAERFDGRYFGIQGTSDALQSYPPVKAMDDSLTFYGKPLTPFFTMENGGPTFIPSTSAGGHGGWNYPMTDPNTTNFITWAFRATNVNFPNQNGNYYEPGNVYQWMLRQGDSILVGSSAPIANAGADQNINLPITVTTFSGTATPQGGHTIASNGYSQVSGPNTATISSSSTLTPTISNLIAGLYVFRLTVIDNIGQTTTDDITVNVFGTTPPSVSAGTDLTITAPVATVTATGTASGNGGATIHDVKWTQTGGSPMAVQPPPPPYGMIDLNNGISGNQMTRYFMPHSDWLAQSTPALLNAYYGVGVRTIRLPADPVLTIVPTKFDSLNNANMPTLDTIVNRIIAAGMNVVIDYCHDLGGGSHIFDSMYNASSSYRLGGRKWMKAIYQHYANYDPTRLCIEIWNEPKDPGVSNVQAQCYDEQDSIIMDMRSVNSNLWIGFTGTGATVGLAGFNYHLTTAYAVPPPPFPKCFGIFHFYLPNIFIFQGKQAANDQGTYNLPYWSSLTQAQAQFVTDSIIANDCGTCNGAYNSSGVGTMGELWTYGHTQTWNLHFMDSIVENAHMYGKINHVPMWAGEYMAFQYGDGVTTGTLRDYRLNWMDDFNATLRKDSIAGNAWDPNGAATRIDSNQAINAPFRFDTALVTRMGYYTKPTIVSPASLITQINNLTPGTFTFQLTATDNNGNSASDQMSVFVLAGSGTKHSPYPVGVGEYQTFFVNPSGVAYGLSAVAANIGRSSATKGVLNTIPVSGGMTFIDVYGTLHGGAGLNTNHRAVTWGDNINGQAGNGTTTGFAPYEIFLDSSGNSMPSLDDMRNYDVGNADVGWIAWQYASTNYRQWGGTRTGIRGDGTLGNTATSKPIVLQVPGGEHIADVRSGYYAILMTTEGHVWTTGGGNLTQGHSSNYSNLGYTFTNQNSDYLTWHKLNLTGIRLIAGGMSWNYAYDSAGKLWAWGQYRHYMGYNTTGNLNVPTDVTALICGKFFYVNASGQTVLDNSGIKQIITNSNGTYAITNMGHLFWWGDNAQGNGGHGTELNYFLTAIPYAWPFTDGLLMDYSPVLVTNKSDWAWVSTAQPFIYTVWAVDSTGHYYAAGRNKADPIPNQLLTATSAQESRYANWGDITWLTPMDPFGVAATYLSTCPYCIPNPTDSTCALYSIPANTPPVANPGPTQNITGTTVTLDGSATTDNVFPAFYEWTQLSGPSTARILVNAAKVTTADNLVNGTYVFQLKVTDNGWLTNTSQLIVNVGTGIPCPSQFCHPLRRFSKQKN